jgi:hypothetical protein
MSEELKPEIVSFIQTRRGSSPLAVSAEVMQKFKQRVSASVVKTIQAQVIVPNPSNPLVSSAKQKGNELLDERVRTISAFEKDLTAMYDSTPGLEAKLNISKELRQWLALGIKISDLDKDTGTSVFVIDSEWATHEPS